MTTLDPQCILCSKNI